MLAGRRSQGAQPSIGGRRPGVQKCFAFRNDAGSSEATGGVVSKYSAVPGPRLGALSPGAMGLMIHCDRCKTRNFMPIGRALYL